MSKHRQCSRCGCDRVVVLLCHSRMDTDNGKPGRYKGVCYRLGCNNKTVECGSIDAVREAWNDLNKDMPFAETPPPETGLRLRSEPLSAEQRGMEEETERFRRERKW